MSGSEMSAKMNRMLDNIHLIFPLFNRALLKPEELTHNPMSSEFRVMLFLVLRDSQPISTIGGLLGISKPNMTAVIDRLIAYGYVERRPSTEDRRIIDISVTTEGRRYMEACKTEACESVRKRLSTLSTEDIDSLCASLENIRLTLMKLSGMNDDNLVTLIEKDTPWGRKF
jgi:DNA-binding MarR family transcriptional regulator